MARQWFEVAGARYRNEKVYISAALSSVAGFCGGRTLNSVYQTNSLMDWNQWPAVPRAADGKGKPGSALLKAMLTSFFKRQGLRFGMCFIADRKGGAIDKYLFKDLKPFTIELARSKVKVVPHMSDWYVNYNHGDKHKVRHCVLIFTKMEKKK